MPVIHSHKAIFVHIPKTPHFHRGRAGECMATSRHRVVPYFQPGVDYEHLYGRQMQPHDRTVHSTVLNDDALFNSYFKFTW